MVQWEQEYLKKEETLTSDSGTIDIDLPKNEQIGMIMLEMRGSHSAAELLGSILNVPTKVEVILEGSKIAFSMTPEIASYMYYLATGRLPNHRIKDGTSCDLKDYWEGTQHKLLHHWNATIHGLV